MPENIVWASPEKTECWAFRGRLYQTKKKALVEQKRHVEHMQDLQARYGDGWWTGHECLPVYKITWKWEEDG